MDTELFLQEAHKAINNGETAQSIGIGMSAISPAPTNTAYKAFGKKGVIPNVVAQILLDHAEDEAIFRQFAHIDSTALVNMPGNTLTLVRKPYFNYDLKVNNDFVNRYKPVSADASGSSAPGNTDSYTSLNETAEITYEEYDVKPVEHRLAVNFTKQLVEDANYDVLNTYLDNLTQKYIRYEDRECVKALIKPGTESATDPTNTDIGVKYITRNGTGFTTGYWNSADINYGTAGSETVTASGTLDVRLLIQALQVELGKYHYNGDILFVEPEQLADLISSTDNQFLFASAYGSNGPLMTGEVGSILGLKIFRTNTIRSVYTEEPGFIPPVSAAGTAAGDDTEATAPTLGHQAILIDSSRAFGVVTKRPLTVESEYKAKDRMYHLYATARFTVFRDEAGAIILINTV